MALFRNIFKKGKKEQYEVKPESTYVSDWVDQATHEADEKGGDATGAMRGVWPYDPKASFQKLGGIEETAMTTTAENTEERNIGGAVVISSATVFTSKTTTDSASASPVHQRLPADPVDGTYDTPWNDTVVQSMLKNAGKNAVPSGREAHGATRDSQRSGTVQKQVICSVGAEQSILVSAQSQQEISHASIGKGVSGSDSEPSETTPRRDANRAASKPTSDNETSGTAQRRETSSTSIAKDRPASEGVPNGMVHRRETARANPEKSISISDSESSRMAPRRAISHSNASAESESDIPFNQKVPERRFGGTLHVVRSEGYLEPRRVSHMGSISEAIMKGGNVGSRTESAGRSMGHMQTSKAASGRNSQEGSQSVGGRKELGNLTEDDGYYSENITALRHSHTRSEESSRSVALRLESSVTTGRGSGGSAGQENGGSPTQDSRGSAEPDKGASAIRDSRGSSGQDGDESAGRQGGGLPARDCKGSAERDKGAPATRDSRGSAGQDGSRSTSREGTGQLANGRRKTDMKGSTSHVSIEVKLPETATDCFYHMAGLTTDTLRRLCESGRNKSTSVPEAVAAVAAREGKRWEDFLIVGDAPLHCTKYCMYYRASMKDSPSTRLLLMVALKEPKNPVAKNPHVFNSRPWFEVDIPTRLIPSSFLAANQPASGLHNTSPVQAGVGKDEALPVQDGSAGGQPGQYDQPWHENSKSVVKSLESSYHAGLLNTDKLQNETLRCFAVILPAAPDDALPMSNLLLAQQKPAKDTEARRQHDSEMLFQVMLQLVKVITLLFFDCNMFCISLKSDDVLLIRRKREPYMIKLAPGNLRKADTGSGFIVCAQLRKLFDEVATSCPSLEDTPGYSRLDKLIQNANDMGDVKAIVKVWETVAWGPSEKEVRSLCMADDREGAFEMWLQMQRLKYLCTIVSEGLYSPTNLSQEQLEKGLFLCSVTGTQLFAVSKLLHAN